MHFHGIVDKKKASGASGHAIESCLSSLFIFQPENILECLRSLDRFKVNIGVLLVSFIWLGEKISLKYLLIDGGDVSPPLA